MKKNNLTFRLRIRLALIAMFLLSVVMCLLIPENM